MSASQHDEPLLQPVTPDHLVALVPCPWPTIEASTLEAIHEEHWLEEVSIELTPCDEEDADYLATGIVRFAGEVVEATLIVEPPMEGIEQSAGLSVDPLTQAEVLMLEQHQSVWRIVIPAGKRLGRRAAKRMTQLLATFIEAGGCAALMPGLMRLHSARIIKRHSMDLFDPQSLTNLFVGAWNQEGWMRTRGLTAFELPEVECSTQGGLNAAYFNLMDVSANMLMQMAAFPSGAELQMGHKVMQIVEAPEERPDDPQVPGNGFYGVQRLKL